MFNPLVLPVTSDQAYELLCLLSAEPAPIDLLAHDLGVGPMMVYELAGLLRRRQIDVVCTPRDVCVSKQGKPLAILVATAYWERTYRN